LERRPGRPQEERPTEEDLALLARRSQKGEEEDTHDSNARKMDEAADDVIVEEEVRLKSKIDRYSVTV
jgi:hypothetical protein